MCSLMLRPWKWGQYHCCNHYAQRLCTLLGRNLLSLAKAWSVKKSENHRHLKKLTKLILGSDVQIWYFTKSSQAKPSRASEEKIKPSQVFARDSQNMTKDCTTSRIILTSIKLRHSFYLCYCGCNCILLGFFKFQVQRRNQVL